MVNGLPVYKKSQPNPSAWGKETIPIDPYCSDADGCWVTIVAEPPAGQSDAFKVIPVNIAVSSGGVGNQSRRIFMVDKWGDVQCQVNKNCGRQWFDEVKLDVETDKLVFSIRPQWGATVTIYDH